MNESVHADWPIQKPGSAPGREKLKWLLGGGLAVLVYLQFFYGDALTQIVQYYAGGS